MKQKTKDNLIFGAKILFIVCTFGAALIPMFLFDRSKESTKLKNFIRSGKTGMRVKYWEGEDGRKGIVQSYNDKTDLVTITGFHGYTEKLVDSIEPPLI